MSDKPIDVVIAESKALLAEHDALAARLDELVVEATVMAARAAGRDPAGFDIDAYLRETLSTADYERAVVEARAHWEQMTAEQGFAPANLATEPIASPRPVAARPHRRMV